MNLPLTFLACLVVFLGPAFACAEDQRGSGFHFEFGQEYSDYNRTAQGGPAKGGRGNSSFLRKAALYIPNRFADLFDVVKLDGGLGVGYGAVIRPTRYLQFGYRDFDPGMLRVGLMGRRWPALLEERRQSGFGSELSRGSKREVSDFEVGAGFDAGVIGVYGGLSLDSALDFLLGWVGIDFEDDDLQ